MGAAAAATTKVNCPATEVPQADLPVNCCRSEPGPSGGDLVDVPSILTDRELRVSYGLSLPYDADNTDGPSAAVCECGEVIWEDALHCQLCGKARTEVSLSCDACTDWNIADHSDGEMPAAINPDAAVQSKASLEIVTASAPTPREWGKNDSMLTEVVGPDMATLPPLPDRITAYTSLAKNSCESGKTFVSAQPTLEVNEIRETIKSIIATVVVGVMVLAIYFWFERQQANFEEPTCEEFKPKGAGDDSAMELPRSCEPCGVETFTFVPMFGEYEKSLPRAFKGTLYFIGLLWVFLGIGIVCDQFMAAIEEITSKKRTVLVEVRPGVKHKFKLRVWNPTIANLTLMALGSSAPEILLNIVELYGNSFFAGELGPSTIVGSAAFNLLVITAVCISALPVGELRRIDQTDVFALTASFSLLAYVWLVIILKVVTPDRVSIGEAIITFAFFPVIVILAYLADKGLLSRLCGGERNKGETAQEKILEAKYGKRLPQEEMAIMLKSQLQEKTSQTVATKAQIRKALMGAMTGGRRLVDSRKTARIEELTFGFKHSNYVVFECAGNFSEITVVANKRPGCTCTMRYVTREGTAAEGTRYMKTFGTLVFSPFQLEQAITIPIIDNDTYDEDEHFHVQLYDLCVGTSDKGARSSMESLRTRNSSDSMLSARFATARFANDVTTVTILNDDMPGTLEWETDVAYVTPGKVSLGISRTAGTTGSISCRYSTKDVDNLAGKAYIEASGHVHMEDGQTHATIEIDVLQQPGDRLDEVFSVVLDEASLGVKFNPDKPGGRKRAVCEIIVRGNIKPWLCRRCCKLSKLRDSCVDYAGQFKAAFYCNGSAAEQASAGAVDWLFHGLSLFWKVIFSIVPPPSFFGGWLCFVCALLMIGGVTAIVADLAGLLGCCLRMPNDICAITLVALGTSLPDTFASKVAAQQNSNADDSIGNVTGSNCVNVFLGLGLPWTIGAIYWSGCGITDDWRNKMYKGETYKHKFLDTGDHPDGGFMVPAGSLTFSVMVFTSCACCCILLLVIRRFTIGGELGGPRFATMRDSTLLVFLWLVYVGLSIWKSLE